MHSVLNGTAAGVVTSVLIVAAELIVFDVVFVFVSTGCTVSFGLGFVEEIGELAGTVFGFGVVSVVFAIVEVVVVLAIVLLALGTVVFVVVELRGEGVGFAFSSEDGGEEVE